MRKIVSSIGALALSVSLIVTSAVPASADTLQIWKTTSSNQYKGIALNPKPAMNGSVAAAKRVFDIPWNWWTGFDIQITDSGTVYLAYSDMDMNMQVATNTTGTTWATSSSNGWNP